MKFLNKKEDMLNCNLGLYKIYWSEDAGGGFSFASIGQNYKGDRWIAPTNWTAPGKQNPTSLLKEEIESIDCLEYVTGYNASGLGR